MSSGRVHIRYSVSGTRGSASLLRFLILSFFLAVLFLPRHPAAQTFGERDTGFLLTLQKTPEPPPGLLVRLVTTSSYPCEGYTIRSRVWAFHDTTSIDISGLTRPSPCFQTNSEATGVAYLGNIRASSFVLRVSYRGDVDLYRIILGGNGALSAVPLQRTFTRLTLR